MTTLHDAARQALAFTMRDFATMRDFQAARAVVQDALRKALAQQAEPVEPVEPHWMTKTLMAEYLDLIAEAIEDGRSEHLRHRAHWMRAKGQGMTTLRTAAQQALEALETLVPRRGGDKYSRAASALRTALAQQAEPAPGWCKHCKQYSIEEPLPAQQAEPKTNWCGETCERAKLCAVCARELAGGQAEPVDQTVMELAESVGLIGPASRAHDLHGAIQRFHDLIVMNASIKAVAAFAAPPQRKPLTEEEIERHIGYRLPAYSMRLLLELVNGRAHGIGGDDGQA